MASTAHLLRLVAQLVADDPAKAARHIVLMEPEEALDVLQALDPRDLGSILGRLEPSFTSKLVQELTAERVAHLLERGGSDVCASVLLSLPEAERSRFLESMSTEMRDRIRESLTFPDDSAGRAMNTDYTAFQRETTVKEAVRRLKKRADQHRRAPSNIYVVDARNTLLGVISMRDLVIATGTAPLEDLMQPDVLTVDPFEEKSRAFQVLSGRGFTSLPVVDPQKRLLGVVRATALLAGAKETAAEDIQKLFGVSKDERSFSSVSFSLRKRLPWLHINLATAFLAASVVALFEDIIARITILAVYLPVVAGQGGNAGAQSLAVVMRGLVMREIPPEHVRRVIFKESLIGVINGAVVGAVTALIAWAWDGNPYLGLVIGLAMVVNLAVAGLAGAGIPIGMRRLGLDPAQSSSIVLTTVTDVIGFFAFLGFAVLFQDLLIQA